MRTREQVIQRLGLLVESFKVGHETESLAKLAAIRELEWVLEIRER